MTADQVLMAEKVELGNFEECGLYEVVERGMEERHRRRPHSQQSGSSQAQEHRKPQCLNLDL